MARVTFLGYLVLGTVLWGCSAAYGGQAAADLSNGFAHTPNTGGTAALFASSYVFGVPGFPRSYQSGNGLGSPSNYLTTRTRTAGTNDLFTTNQNVAYPGVILNNAFKGGPFTSILGVRNLPKPTVDVTDHSSSATGTVSYDLLSSSHPYLANAGTYSSYIYASAQKNPFFANDTTPGTAAAIAYDPFTLSSAYGPSYAYSPTFDASLQLDDATETGEVVLFATDDYSYPRGSGTNNLDYFVENGQPLGNTLWTLSIAATGPISSVSQLSIAFNLNPAAEQELNLSTTPGYSASLGPNDLANLVDNYVESNLQDPGVISIGSDGTAGITAFSPFAPGTTFTPAFGSSEENADGVETSIMDVPEPGSFVVIGMVGLGLLRRRTVGKWAMNFSRENGIRGPSLISPILPQPREVSQPESQASRSAVCVAHSASPSHRPCSMPVRIISRKPAVQRIAQQGRRGRRSRFQKG